MDSVSENIRGMAGLLADKDYVHDPDHKKKPEGGGWHETEKGWSRKGKDGNPSAPGKPDQQKPQDKPAGDKARVEDLRKRLREASGDEEFDKIVDGVLEDKGSTFGELRELYDNVDWSSIEQDPNYIPFAKKFFRHPSLTPEFLKGDYFQSVNEGEMEFGDTMEGDVKFDAIAANPNTPAEVLDDMVEKWEERDNLVGKWEPVEGEDNEYLDRVPDQAFYQYMSTIIDNPNLPQKTLKRIANTWLQEDIADYARKKLKGGEKEPEKKKVEIPQDHEGKARLANDLTTDADTLKELAKDEDQDIRTRAAANPNATAEMLKELAGDDEATVRRGVAGNHSTPSEIVGDLTKDNELFVALNALQNKNCPVDILVKTCREGSVPEVAAAASNPSTPTEELDDILRGSIEHSVAEAIAANPNASDQALKYISAIKVKSHPFFKVAVAMAKEQRQQRKERKELEKNFHSEDWKERLDVAFSNLATPEMLETLSQDENSVVRVGVAKNPNTSRAVLQNLGKDSDDNVRACVAKNRNASPETLDELSRDKNDQVVEHLLDNDSFPAEKKKPLFEKLSKSDQLMIRFRVASRMNAPADVLLDMLQDSDENVRREAAQSIRTISHNDDTEKVKELAGDIRTPGDILDSMSHSNFFNKDVLRSIAGNPSAQFDTLERLAKNQDKEVAETAETTLAGNLVRDVENPDFQRRMYVARNPHTPTYALKELLKDSDENIRREAQATIDKKEEDEWKSRLKNADPAVRTNTARMKEVPKFVLRALSKDNDGSVRRAVASNEAADGETLAELAGDSDESVRRAVSENPSTPPGTLASFADSQDKTVRAYVANNPSLPADKLKKLCGDSEWNVRAMAYANPACPADWLPEYKDQPEAVRYTMTMNPNVTVDKLKEWAEAERNHPKSSKSISDVIDKEIRKRGTSSADLKKAAEEGDDTAKDWLEARKKLRRDFCVGKVGDGETYEQMKSYKKAIGEKKGFGRSPEQVKQDFIKNMSPAKYDSPEAFQKAKERIQKMPVKQFDALLAIVYNQAEDEEA
ncbi:MAG: HEAT repeat domain-containing protein [Clostridia bacterium]|nr:HEAT repeat domain-containing protein [Clostridia bacterium]